MTVHLDPIAEVLHLKDLLGQANALARIRAERIRDLEEENTQLRAQNIAVGEACARLEAALKDCEAAFKFANEEMLARGEALRTEAERNFCPRCGKRLVGGGLHTCTPPDVLSTQSKIPRDTPMTDEQIEQAYRQIYRKAETYTHHEFVEAGIRYAEKHYGIGQ